jgi:phosphatidylserine/phosphatidylglycerophosphate/cardiolipin synthase-like enzyme
MPKIIAVSNNDIALAAWSFDKKIADCVGFALYRIDINAGTETPLPALAGFKNDPNVGAPGHTTEQGPVQKFNWKDLYAKRGGLYKYKVVPLSGTFPKLQPMNIPPLISNPVQLSPNRGVITSFFNRGILATQSTAKQITVQGQPSKGVLLKRIAQQSDPLRKSLAGDMIQALPSLLERARLQGGQCYLALYELNDNELLSHLLGAPYVHLILSNTGVDDAENSPARLALHESKIDITDRMVPDQHIGHNKFCVYVDAEGNPAAVLLGSTNWTFNGMCAQTNNTLIVESKALAAQYFDYWQRMKKDTDAAGGNSKALQGQTFRSDNDHVRSVTLEDNSASIDLWFSPNTKAATKGKSAPDDMQEVFDLMANAKQAILFLAFFPGNPSIIDAAAKAQAANSDLLVRGALTNPGSANQFSVDLMHLTGAQTTSDNVIPATGINDQFGVWEKELNSAGFAIIHDKIVVVDPFSENCAVITGSHNLGYRASSANDENLVIVKGHRGLAEAYATHVLDVYDHYRWRFLISKNGAKNAFTGLDTTDKWQDKYFDQNGNLSNPELKLWLSADPNAQARRNVAGLGSTRPISPSIPTAATPAKPAKKTSAKGTAKQPKKAVKKPAAKVKAKAKK